MAREMTPQERAAIQSFYYRLHAGVEGGEFQERYEQEDIGRIIELLAETRRAALLEAAQVIEDDCYGGVDYFSDADTTLSFTDQMKRAHNKNQAKLAEQVRKLAQEG